MRLDDAAEIRQLNVQLGYPDPLVAVRRRMQALLDSERHFLLVAEDGDGALVGWIAAERRFLLTSDERVELIGLVVDERVRRQRVGHALVASAERWCAACGLDTVFLRSNAAREASHPFYERLGYERIKTQHAYRRRFDAQR
ncbi:GNAT family N-acetyltransferase [Oleiagrimonas soli]|uniref:GNAT superfamily N-acetyltransferase n=1 Tax=Oleiagrimonas soli TaxID=1543381 RepID=A0A099CU94_9GAMM|nr:GNAT family N-acetyltransferase [Oleiagrimonas soli]KGI77503.1 hypothetical protein LF63_0109185 [Oleiagrimonas soli]MBB6183032.1 GNAT superfamily N-acetyltransferase [Oleiagrimonas soli]